MLGLLLSFQKLFKNSHNRPCVSFISSKQCRNLFELLFCETLDPIGGILLKGERKEQLKWSLTNWPQSPLPLGCSGHEVEEWGERIKTGWDGQGKDVFLYCLGLLPLLCFKLGKKSSQSPVCFLCLWLWLKSPHLIFFPACPEEAAREQHHGPPGASQGQPTTALFTHV